MKNWIGWRGGCIFLGVWVALNVWAAEPARHRLEGVVAKVAPNAIWVDSGGEIFELDRNRIKPKDEGVQVGDKVTIFYSLNVQDIAFQKQKHRFPQQPGKQGPQEKQIIDDRAFYSAKNE